MACSGDLCYLWYPVRAQAAAGSCCRQSIRRGRPVAGAFTRPTRVSSLRTTTTDDTVTFDGSSSGTDWAVWSHLQSCPGRRRGRLTLQSPRRPQPKAEFGSASWSSPESRACRPFMCSAPQRPSKGICGRAATKVRCRPTKLICTSGTPTCIPQRTAEQYGWPHEPFPAVQISTCPRTLDVSFLNPLPSDCNLRATEPDKVRPAIACEGGHHNLVSSWVVQRRHAIG